MYNLISSQLSDLLKINRLSNDNQTNQINNTKEEVISYKNQIDIKKGEIFEFNEKIKDLTTNLNIEKKNQDFMNINKNLKEEIEKLNIKVSDLTNENINNQQQIFDLSNLDNILKISK